MKKLLIITLSLVLLQMQLFSQYKNYDKSGNIKIISEKTTLKISMKETQLKPTEQAGGLLIAAGTIIPTLIDLTVKNVKRKVKKSSLAYQGEYKCKASGENFYTAPDNANLPILTITRIIKDEGGKDVVAAKMKLTPVIDSNKTAFRYYVKEVCLYNYSIAKTKKIYDFIDLSIEIKFKSLSVNKGVYKLNDLRTTFIEIPMIHVGETKKLDEKYYSGWIPMPPRSNAKTTKDSTNAKEIKKIEKTNSAGIKESSIQETVTTKYITKHYERLAVNTGLYEFTITVKETNPYKIKAENKNEIIESSSESIGEVMKAIVGTITKSEEETE